jgi:DNA-binding SARP family transcriptional activator
VAGPASGVGTARRADRRIAYASGTDHAPRRCRDNGGWLSLGYIGLRRCPIRRLAHAGSNRGTEGAFDLLDEALELWRGPAFDALAELDAIRIEAIRLDQLRLNTNEDRFQLLPDLGRLAAAIPELEAFVAVQPMRERARALLMQALYWAGRQSDALAAYVDYRSLMGDGMGLEPSPQLKKLEESIVFETLDQRPPAIQGRARLFGRQGRRVAAGPTVATLEQEG